jgi:hypothetical protein
LIGHVEIAPEIGQGGGITVSSMAGARGHTPSVLKAGLDAVSRLGEKERTAIITALELQ